MIKKKKRVVLEAFCDNCGRKFRPGGIGSFANRYDLSGYLMLSTWKGLSRRGNTFRIVLNWQAQFIFCCEECRDKFIERKTRKK